MIPNNKKFEPLRNMDEFTTDMFNRIIAFQEKDYPAWKPDLSFEQRISGLPLHNLIFSNPDRNPENNGPTVAAYYPLKEEIQKIAAYIRQLPTVDYMVDWIPGNGLIGSLIAREGVTVKGVIDNNGKPNQIERFHDPKCYEFINKVDISSCDAAFVSWPSPDSNPSPELIKLSPTLLIYVYTDYVDESSGKRQTGCEQMITDLNNDYTLVDEWCVTRPENILHEIWPDLTRNIEETRIVRVYSRNDINIQKIKSVTPGTTYDWENDLLMAKLALEAKQELRAKGIRI